LVALAAVAAVAAVAKKLRCWLGLHHWVRYVNDAGEPFHRCADCDKFKDIRNDSRPPNFNVDPPGF
jgi:hypothetical protein